MATRRIAKHGEKVLHRPSEKVDYEAIKPDLPKLLKDMWETMYKAKGVGLAAPQIGLNMRLAVIDVRPDGKPQRLVLINPEIVSMSGWIEDDEGCLSVPGLYAPVRRHARARIKAFDKNGEPYEMSGAGLLARAFQHEIDHLYGKVFIDRIPLVRRVKIHEVLKDIKKNWN